MGIYQADGEAIREAARALRAGKLVAFPTETVYGLGGDARSDRAVADIYALKGRPNFNPLIVHVADLARAERLAVFSSEARALAKAFWPGPMTLVLPRREDSGLSLLVSAGMDTVALRVPGHPLAHALLEAAAIPIAAPSANRSGRVSPTLAAHVAEELEVPLILDGGPCPVGIESTVIDLTGEMLMLLRPGSVTAPQIEQALGRRVMEAGPGAVPRAPGMLERHYAPSLPLRLNARAVESGEGLLAFGAPLAGAVAVENLSEKSDLREAAANLFLMLRRLDSRRDIRAIAVMPIPGEGLGRAINDRLRRAAAR